LILSKGKLLAVCLLWLAIAGLIALTYRFVWAPSRQRATIGGTSASSHYRHEVKLALDSFSGYALLRAPEFKEQLSRNRIRLTLRDDHADYAARIRALRSGEVDLATFTIDALITASAELGEMPATIVAIVDESRGANAILAYKSSVPNIDALNRQDLRFVLTRGSSSETLVRVVMSRFQLDRLAANPWTAVSDAAEVFERYRQGTPSDAAAFVTWEPYVSRILENPQVHTLVDSATFRGYIVDVIVANRDFLLKNEDVMQEFLAAYFRVAYDYRDRMPALLQEDAQRLGEPLTPRQAEQLARGIWWKNTLENFAHFGIDTSSQLQLLEDMILNLRDVLLQTQAIERDPIRGGPQTLFYDRALRTLSESNFHPRLAQEHVRSDSLTFQPLSDDEWQRLVPLGTLAVPDLVFARGTARLTEASQQVLDQLANELKDFPTSYLLVRGNASNQGDIQANTQLAGERAAAARNYLLETGLDPNRVQAVGGEPQGESTVSFVLGQPPY
jgi:hypothetical protein